MRGRILAGLAAAAAILLASPTSFAQMPVPSEIDVRPVISDLNAVASISKDELSNFDVAVIAGVACATMRVAARERYAERIGAALQRSYPSSDQVRGTSLERFIEFKRDTLLKYGASDQAINLVEKEIRDYPNLPTSAPASVGLLRERVSKLESESCNLRAQPVAAPAAPASAKDASWGRCLRTSVVGAGVMVVNYGIVITLTPYTGLAGLGAFILGGISVSWGWNRLEEACF